MYSGIQKLWSVSLLPECPIRLIWYRAPIFLASDLIFEINSEGQQTQGNKKSLPCPNPSPQVTIACLRMERGGGGHRYISLLEFSLGISWRDQPPHVLSLTSTTVFHFKCTCPCSYFPSTTNSGMISFLLYLVTPTRVPKGAMKRSAFKEAKWTNSMKDWNSRHKENSVVGTAAC